MSEVETIRKCALCGQCYAIDLGIVEVGGPLCAACRKTMGFGGLFVSTKRGVQ